jgi:hypothetical protein
MRGLTGVVVFAALLAAAQSARAVIVLDIGDDSAPVNGVVLLPVTIAGASGPLGGAQLDILYPTAALSVPDPETACDLASGHPGSVVTAAPSSPPPPPGKQRLRVLVFDLQGGSFGNGELVRCRFTVKGTAQSGAYAVSGDGSAVSDPAGNALSSQVSGGTAIVCPGCC